MRITLPGMYDGVKNGNPMMCSQCVCDRKTLKRDFFAGPCFAISALPNSRTPEPTSHSTYSSPPASISTQLELPPYVPLVENGRSFAMKLSTASGGTH